MPELHAASRPVRCLSLLRALVLSALLACPLLADLQREVDLKLASPELKDARIAVMVSDVQTDRTLVDRNSDESMIPASNLKLYTSAAALRILGEDFAFHTQLQLAGDNPQQALLLVRGDGDPGFGDPKLLAATPAEALAGTPYAGQSLDVELLLKMWVDQVVSAGVKHVDRLVLDDRMFDQEWVHPTWPREQLHHWYCAQVSGINFHTNVMEIRAFPGLPEQAPVIRFVPENDFVTLVNRATTAAGDTFWVSRKLGTNDLLVAGKLRASRTGEITIHDPALFFGRLLAQRLAKQNITVAAVERAGDDEVLPAGRLLHSVRTPLREALARCNKDSQNLYAEAMLKRIGRHVTGRPGSWESGTAAARIVLQELMGPLAADVRMIDGSGLSRDNRVTARTTVELLRSMIKDPKLGPIYRDSLSIAGKDGSLRERLENLQGTVYGKSGYIAQVRCLSGYVVSPPVPDKPQRTLAFSILMNDIKPSISSERILKLRDDLVRLIDAEAAR